MEIARLEFAQMPSFGESYLKILRSRRNGGPMPALVATVRNVRFEPAHVKAFRKVAQAPAMHGSSGGTPIVPITYPHVRAGSLHGALLAHPSFPHPALGLVHVANRIRQWVPMLEDSEWDVSARIEGQRDVARGVEFDIITEFRKPQSPASGTDGLVWDQTTTVLCANKKRPRKAVSEHNEGIAPTGAESTSPSFEEKRSLIWRVPEDSGRRYAAVSGDYNPIHLHALAAKAFGFKRAIATGMWTLARCAAELDSDIPAGAVALDVAFRRPILLPSRVLFRSGSIGQGQGEIGFTVATPDGAKLHLEGKLAQLASS